MTSKRARWPPLFITFLSSSWLVTSVYQVLAKIYVRFFYYGITLIRHVERSRPANFKHHFHRWCKQITMWCKSLTLEKYISFRIKWFFSPPFLSVSPFLLLNLVRRQCHAYAIGLYTRPEITSWPDVKFCAHAHCVLPRCCFVYLWSTDLWHHIRFQSWCSVFARGTKMDAQMLFGFFVIFTQRLTELCILNTENVEKVSSRPFKQMSWPNKEVLLLF